MARESVVERRKNSFSKKELRHLFWDFYALNFLWSYLIGERAIKDGIIMPSARERYIEKLYSDNLEAFFPLIIDALERSCRCEARYAFERRPGGYFDAPSDYDSETLKKKKSAKFLEYKKNVKIFSNWIKRFPEKSEKTNAWKVKFKYVVEAFSYYKLWESAYGGQKWHEGAKLFVEAQPHLKNFDFKKWSFFIDRILDLKHNSGVLLNKTELEVISEAMLNRRAKLKYIDAFCRVTSPKVSRLVRSCLPYVPPALIAPIKPVKVKKPKKPKEEKPKEYKTEIQGKPDFTAYFGNSSLCPSVDEISKKEENVEQPPEPKRYKLKLHSTKIDPKVHKLKRNAKFYYITPPLPLENVTVPLSATPPGKTYILEEEPLDDSVSF